MIGNLVRQWFFQGDNKKYFTSNNQMAHYGMHLFVNWMREKLEKVLEQFFKKERCEAEITTELLFLDLAESNSDLLY